MSSKKRYQPKQEDPVLEKLEKVHVVRKKEGTFFVSGNKDKAYLVNPGVMTKHARAARHKGKHNKQDFWEMIFYFGFPVFFITLIPSVLIIPKVDWILVVQVCIGFGLLIWSSIYAFMGSVVLRMAKFLAWIQAGLCLAALLVFAILERDLRYESHKWWHILYGILVGLLTIQTLWAIYFVLVVTNLLHAYLIFTAVYSEAVTCLRHGKTTTEQNTSVSRAGRLFSSLIGLNRDSSNSYSFRFNRYIASFFSFSSSTEPPLGTTVRHSKDK